MLSLFIYLFTVLLLFICLLPCSYGEIKYIYITKKICLSAHKVLVYMDVPCASLSSFVGIVTPWVKEIRYLGVYTRTFKCSLSNNRKAFYRSANAILGKIGGIASEEVVLQLVENKCISSLLWP